MECSLQKVALELRKTHSYVGTFDYLNEHEYVGTASVVVSQSYLMDDSDPTEPTKTVMLVEVQTDQPEPLGRIAQAINDSFSMRGCHHEWDCCGCWSTYAKTIAHAAHGKFMVETLSSRNY